MPNNPNSLDDSFTLTEEKSEDFEVSSSSNLNSHGSSKGRRGSSSIRRGDKKPAKNGGGGGGNNPNSIKDFDSSYNFTNLPREELQGSSSRLSYRPSTTISQQRSPSQQDQSTQGPQQQDPQFIPQGKLPFRGRHGELTSLYKAMERISLEWMENPSEVVWVSGPRGVGKTTLVEHAMTSEGFAKAMVCRGLCEQHSTAAQPFSALSECLSHLCIQLLKNNSTNGQTKAMWKNRLEEALGGEGPLVCSICPPLSQLLECAPMERRLLMTFDTNALQRLNRLTFAVRDLLQAVSEVLPLCMVVDNIHFADADSLQLMEELLSTKPLQNFLLIGIYDTKVSSPALAEMKKSLTEDANTKTNEIRLQGFTSDELKDVIIQLFLDNHNDSDAMEIADIVFALTKGNPLWVVQLLKLWQEQKLITLENMKWECNRKKIKKEVKQWRDDGLECYKSCEGVIQARIKLLPKKIQFAVIIMAKLKLTHFRIDDPQFYRVLIAANYRKAAKTDKDPITSQGELEKMIQKACQYGIIQKRNRPGWFKFLNDVVRECAASLPSPYEIIAKKGKPNEVSKLDLYIGTELSNMASEPGSTSPEQRDRYKLLAVEVLKNGTAAMEEAEKAKYAKLNLEAAEIAMCKTAFQTAIVYLERAVTAVDHRVRWQPQQYDVTLRIFLFLARMRLCCGRNAASKAACEEIFDNCTTVKDRVYANQVFVIQLQQEGKHDEALERLLAVLKKVGESLPDKGDVDAAIQRDFAKMSKKLGTVQNQQLLNPKKVTDKKAMDTMMILAHLVEVGRAASPNRYAELATLRMMQISLDIGFTRQYPLAFSLMSVLLVERGQVKEAHRLGQVAEKIARLTDFYGGEAVALFHWHVSHWRRPYKRILEPVLRIYNAQVDSGDFCHVGFSISTYVQYHLVSGFDIEKLSDNIQLFEGLYTDFNLNDLWFIEISQQAVSNLLGESSYPLIFFGATLAQQDEKMDELRDNGYPQAVEYFFLLRLYLAFFFQDLEVMEECFERLPDPVQGVWIPWVDFMHCFLLIQYLPESKGKGRKELKEKIELFRNRLVECYNEGNPNVNAMTAILDAEWLIAKESGKGSLSAMKAQEVFKVAVDTAAQDGVVHLEAFACERAGRHFNITGVEGFSSEYFIRSHKAYDKCHYVAKVIDLETNFASMLKITKRRARPGSAYIEHNATLKPSNKEIGGGQHEAKTVNLVKGIKKTAKRIKGVKNTSRKVKALFKKEKAEPAPWGWNSKNKMALDDDEEAIPGSPTKSPIKNLSSRLLGKGKRTDADNDDKELSPGLPLSPSPSPKPRKSVLSSRLLGRSKKQVDETEMDKDEASATVSSAPPSPKPRSSLFSRRGGKKKANPEADDVVVEESPSPPPSPTPSSKAGKGRPSQRRSGAPKSARDQQPVEAIDDMLESPKPRASRALDIDAGPMNIPFGDDSEEDEDVPVVTKKKETKAKRPSRRDNSKGN